MVAQEIVSFLAEHKTEIQEKFGATLSNSKNSYFGALTLAKLCS
jgi:hypothetical protein